MRNGKKGTEPTRQVPKTPKEKKNEEEKKNKAEGERDGWFCRFIFFASSANKFPQLPSFLDIHEPDSKLLHAIVNIGNVDASGAQEALDK